MDAKSINFLFGVISSFIGLLFLFYIMLSEKHNWFLITYTFSKFLQAIGVFCFSFRYTIPDYLSLNLGSIFLILGYALEVFNVISYDYIFRRTIFLSSIIPIIPFIILILALTKVPYYHLIKLVSFMAAYYFSLGAFSLYIKRERTKFVILISVTYLFFSLAWIIQIVESFLENENYKIMSGESPYLIALYIFAALNLIIGSVGYLLLIKERFEQSIREKNIRIESDNRLLKELNIKKDKFFSIIAHDLKSPIGALIQLGKVLDEDHNELPASEREELIHSIASASRKTYNLLENLLHWTRSETGRLTVKPTKLNIKEIIEGTLNLYKVNINQKKITIRNEIKENTYALGDYNMITTVIRNLISNAVKYVYENGNICLSSKIDLSENKIIIDISDDGVGIKQEIINKLFDIDNDYTTKGTNNEGGTGLGLKLCKEFISKNDGDIMVTSEIGKGSSFKIKLPISD